MRVLVTGASGYIGRKVVQCLVEKGQDVVACVRTPDETLTDCETVIGDIFSLGSDFYHRISEPEVCIHLAWEKGFEHHADVHMGHLSGHFTFLKNLLDCGLKRLTVMGTMHEVGYYVGAVNEQTPCHPLSLYGLAKKTLRESLDILKKSRDFTFQWARAYYIYGDDSRNHSIFAKILKAEEEGKKTFPLNSGKNKYDFIAVRDLAEQISALALQDSVTGIVECCSGVPVSLGEMVERFIAQNGLTLRPNYGYFKDRPYDSPAIWGDNTKIRKILVSGGQND